MKFDAIVLARHGVTLRGLDTDTMLASYLIDATRSEHKLAELRTLLDLPGTQLLTLDDVGVTGQPIEDGETFETNARIKARAAGVSMVATPTISTLDARFAKRSPTREPIAPQPTNMTRSAPPAWFCMTRRPSDESPHPSPSADCGEEERRRDTPTVAAGRPS